MNKYYNILEAILDAHKKIYYKYFVISKKVNFLARYVNVFISLNNNLSCVYRISINFEAWLALKRNDTKAIIELYETLLNMTLYKKGLSQ